jgi:three-Cys-motif partner protein
VSVEQCFGGKWTEEKLKRLKKYLRAYTIIFDKNVKAKFFITTYVDGFAGTGSRFISKEEEDIMLPFFEDEDVINFKQGSAQIALEVEPSFDRYIFIELNPNFASELKNFRQRYPHKANKIKIIQKDANNFIQDWCSQTNWAKNRAVVFLDPYGMQVEWDTIKAIAETKAIDLWILFPVGQAVNRLLTKRKPPEGIWAEKLTKIFGTEEWKKAFYAEEKQTSLFGSKQKAYAKTANFDTIGKFFVKRLEKIFAKVAHNPLQLCNSKNVPIFLLCFAAGNPKGAKTAVKIAENILSR